DKCRQLVLDTIDKYGKPPPVMVYGKLHEQPRLVAYFAIDSKDKYKYSGGVNPSRGWPSLIAELAAIGESLIPSGRKLTRGLINFYRSGQDRVGRHADKDALNGYIVSFSFYPVSDTNTLRKFMIRKGKWKQVILLGH